MRNRLAGRRQRVLVTVVVVSLALVTFMPGIADAAARRGGMTSSATASALGDFVPAFHCSGSGSPSFSGTGLDAGGLDLAVRRVGRGASTIEHVTLRGKLRFTLDAQLVGNVRCTASALVPVAGLPGVRAGPDLSIETTGRVAADFTWAPSIDLSFDLSRHGFTHPIRRFGKQSGVVFSGAGTVRLDVFLEATAGTRARGPVAAGLIATVGPEITAVADVNAADHELCWTITGQVAASLNAYVSVWHWLHANKTWAARFLPFAFPSRCVGQSSPTPTYVSVPLATLCRNPQVQSHAVNGCPYPGSSEIGGGAFERVILIEDNDESVTPTFWDLFNFPATSCHSIELSFGMPTNGSKPGDSASLRVTAGSLAPQTASVGYGEVATLEATLDDQPWSLENSATNVADKIAIDGTASCTSASGY